MIPVEYFWITIIFIFGVIGAVRGLHKELGVTAIVAISLFVMYFGWAMAAKFITSLVQRGPLKNLTLTEIEALYYTVGVLFVAFIAYEGVVLMFPSKLKGFLQNMFGFFGGLLNGYLIAGTIWNVMADAKYFCPQVCLVTYPYSDFHNTVVKLLPVSLMTNFSPWPMLLLGFLLLLAIIFK
jgi:uncharacterized membrane protein required for colicin V production